MADGARQVEADDWRRLGVCAGCDYSMETLPGEGVCPECGRGYDRRFVVLVGQGRGRWDTVAGGTWRGMVAGVVAIAALVWVLVDGPKFQHVLVGVFAAAMWAVQWYAWLFSSREPGVQLWLSGEGVGQMASTPEARRARALVEGVGFLCWPLFYVGMFFDERGPGRWVLLAFIVFATAIGWALRGSRREGEEEGTVEGAGGGPRLWPWGRVKRVEVQALAGERLRVRCQVARRGWGDRVRDVWVIDIEIACAGELAEGLRRQMEAWRSAAGEGG